MKPHDWAFLRVFQKGQGQRQLVEMCWQCGIVSVTDVDGTFRINVRSEESVPEDCNETIVQEVHIT
jgi:hypothetical protein